MNHITDTDREVLENAIEAFGEAAQLDIAIEECGELITAISRFHRNRTDSTDIIKEAADVAIMAHQLAILYDKEDLLQEEIGEKMARLNYRIQEENINAN